MKKKFVVLVFLVLAMCAFTLCINAIEDVGCEHEDNWQIDFDDTKVLTQVYSMNICSKCNVVLAEESIAPLIQSKGFSYRDGSIVQGYSVDAMALAKYESRANKSIDYGVVAAVQEISGSQPLGTYPELSKNNVVAVNMKSRNTEHFEIKITSIPNDKYEMKIILCAYLVIDGEVIYVDNGYANQNVAGITYNEVVALFESGIQPQGIETHRELTLDELDLWCGAYWSSDIGFKRNIGNNTAQSYFATKSFTREELPVGSYILLGQGMTTRPELFKSNGKREGNRPNAITSSEEFKRIELSDIWGLKSEEHINLGFNISSWVSDGKITDITEESIASAFKIFVPVNTVVSKRAEAPEKENVSVTGLKLLSADEIGLKANKFWSSTTTTEEVASGDAAYYYITKKLTKEELPVNSVIEVAIGWQYRPEYWVGSNKNKVRPYTSSVYRIVVTEDFWDTETTRAFNISRITETKLTQENFAEVVAAFKIYVPSTSSLYN